ncbi:porin [Aquabacterium humicola]|uniref:porin n=1 Tax=Aquabacterium humicola TaxID=3237377 RepID=UPI002542B913|nr:porin [Rubrivivax pictus]
MKVLPSAQRVAAAAAMALAAFGAAQAQSTVTIYGIIDQGLVKANSGTTPGALLPGRGAAPDVWTMKAGNTSRLGFRSQEDLGDGLYARFQIEHRFAADTGTPSNASVFWLGRSVVAVGSRTAGELYAGREYSAAYAVALNADPTYWSYVSQLGSAYTYANYTPVAATIEASNIRWSNTVGYKSPSWAGVSVELATAFGEGTRKRASSGNVQYRQGPLWVAAAFDRLDAATNLALVAAGYDFGFVQPKASFSRAEGGLNGDATSWTVSALMPLDFGRTYVAFGRLSPATGLDASMVGGGLQYDLSKRTLLYTNVGSAKRDGLTRTTAVDVGVKHTF